MGEWDTCNGHSSVYNSGGTNCKSMGSACYCLKDYPVNIIPVKLGSASVEVMFVCLYLDLTLVLDSESEVVSDAVQ